MKRATYYHAGCPVCVEAERGVLGLLDKSQLNLSIVHLGQNTQEVERAKLQGVQSVPALVIDGTVFHINMGAPLSALVGGRQ